MTYRPHPKYASNDPRQGPWSTCDSCNFVVSQSDLKWQYDYVGGPVPQSQGWLVCPRCINPLTQQRQLIVLPPDPPPIFNTRPENYAIDETSFLLTQDAEIITTQSAVPIGTNIPNPEDNAATAHLQSSISAPSGSVAVAYLDIYNGNPVSGGYSVLARITGSNTRTNVASSLETANGVATNTSTITVSSASEATVNVSYCAIYDAATGGTLLMSGPLNVYGPTVTEGNPVVFSALGLTINLN